MLFAAAVSEQCLARAVGTRTRVAAEHHPAHPLVSLTVLLQRVTQRALTAHVLFLSVDPHVVLQEVSSTVKEMVLYTVDYLQAKKYALICTLYK